MQKFLQKSLPFILQLNKHGKFDSVIRNCLSRLALLANKKIRKKRERERERERERNGEGGEDEENHVEI